MSKKRMGQMDLIFKALDFAAMAHRGQTRNDDALPYIVHPVGVGILLAKIGADEETIAAGFLHDTIEDCNVTKEDLEKEFGKDVARIVNDVTEQDRSLSWYERKYKAIDHLKVVEKESLLVKSADIINNLSSTLEEIKAEGLAIFDRYNASYPTQVKMNRKRCKAIEERWSDNPLLPQLKELVDKLAGVKNS